MKFTQSDIEQLSTWFQTGAPAAHASTHAAGGSDPITVADSQLSANVALLNLPQTFAALKTFAAGIVANGAISGSGTITLTGAGANQLTGALGLGVAAGSAKLNVDAAYTDGGVRYGALTTVASTVTVNGSNYILAYDAALTALTVPSGVTDSGYRVGFRAAAYANTSGFAGTLASQYGVWARAGILAATAGAQITSVYGVYAEILNSAAGTTITNAYGVYIANAGTTGTITNRYDLWAGSANAKSYFAGTVGIGTTAPTARLHLPAGTAAANQAPLKLTAGTLNTVAEAGTLEYTTAGLFFTPSSGVRNTVMLSTFTEALDVTLGTTTGTKIGTSTTQKLGFWNKTPVVQPALTAYTSNTESTAYTGIASGVAGTPYAQLTDLNALRTAYETLRAAYDDLRAKLITTGIVA